MAVVRFDGEPVTCEYVRADGQWLFFKSLQHASRLSVGTVFKVKRGDVISDDRPVGRLDSGLTTLMTALAKERETLPAVRDVIRGNPPIAPDAPTKVADVEG